MANDAANAYLKHLWCKALSSLALQPNTQSMSKAICWILALREAAVSPR